MNLALIVIIFLGLSSHSVETRTSCGTLLVDHLEFICGARGTRRSWLDKLANKYPNTRARYSRHTELPIPDDLLRQMIDSLSTLYDTSNQQSTGALSTSSQSRRSTRTYSRRKRVARRDIVARCCHNGCSLKEMEARYCARA